jgi:O-antigen/teichoic acid export membrane protein
LSKLRPTTRVARGATYLFIQGFASAVISLVYFVILARMLSSVEMGIYALLSFTLGLIPVIGNFALPSATVKYIAQYLAEGQAEKAKSMITRLLQIWMLTSLVAFIVLFFPAEALSRFMFGLSEHALLLRLLAFSSAFTMLHLLMVSCLQGLQKIREVAITNFVYATSQSIIGASLLLAGLQPRLLAVVLGGLIGSGISAVVGLFLALKYLGLVSKPHPLKPLISFSYPLYISNIVYFVSTWVDRLLIFSYVSTFLGSTKAQEWLGVYHVAVRASLIPTLFSTALLTALFPQLSELYTQQGLNSLKDAFRVSMRYLALIGFPMIVGLATLSKPLILIFAGQSYAAASLPLAIICFAALPATLGVAIGPILLTLERTKVVSIITVLSILFNLSASYVALAYFKLGLPGPALSRTFSAVIAFGLSVFALRKAFSLDFDREALWKAALSSLFMSVVIFLLDLIRQTLTFSSSQLFDIDLFLLSLYMIVGATTYFFSLVALKTIKKYDVEMLRDYLPKGFKWIANWVNDLARPN